MEEKSEVLEAMPKETVDLVMDLRFGVIHFLNVNCVWFISFWFDGIELCECRKTYPLKRFLRI